MRKTVEKSFQILVQKSILTDSSKPNDINWSEEFYIWRNILDFLNILLWSMNQLQEHIENLLKTENYAILKQSFYVFVHSQFKRTRITVASLVNRYRQRLQTNLLPAYDNRFI